MIEINYKRVFAASFIIAALVLIAIPGIRMLSGNPVFTGDFPYYHARMSGYIAEKGIPVQDPSIKRIYLLEPYHLVIAGLSRFLDVTSLLILVPILCGLVSVIVAYLILKEFKIGPLHTALVEFSLIFSPLFLFLFSTANSYALTTMLVITASYLFMKKRAYFIPSFIIFSLMPFFGLLPCLISLSVILVYSLNQKEKLKQFCAILIAMAVIAVAYWAPIIYRHGVPDAINIERQNVFTKLIADLGSSAGLGVFEVLLMCFGMYFVWKLKKQRIGYVILFLLGGYSLYDPSAVIYLIWVISLFKGFGIAGLINMRWESDLIKRLTIALIFCGLLFSTVSYVTRASEELPDTETVQSLEWLKEKGYKEDVVFSHYTKGFWIESIAEKKAVLDSNTVYVDKIKERINTANELFYSRTLKKTKEMLDRNKIKYIWIDKDMKEGKVWTREDEGLLFLFRNEETFKKIYSNNKTEIWEVIQ